MPTFDSDSAKRISNAVVQVERMPRFYGAGASTMRTRPEGFWAQITDSDGANNKYSWVAVSPSGAGTWSQNTEWGQGSYDESLDVDPDLPACEFTGCVDVIHNDFVWLFPTPGQRFYSFLYAPPMRYASLHSALSGTNGTAYVGASQQIKVYNLLGGTVPQNSNNLPLQVVIGYSLINGKGSWEVIKVACNV